MDGESISQDDLNQIDNVVEQCFPQEAERSRPRISRRNSVGATPSQPQEPRTSFVAKLKARRRGSETSGGWTGRRSVFGGTRRGSGRASFAFSSTRKLGRMLRRGSLSDDDDDMVSVVSTTSSLDSDDHEGLLEKTLLGIKHNLGRYNQEDKEVAMVVHMENMGEICEVDARPSEVISRIRKKIESDTTRAIPRCIRFCYSDGNPVESLNEGTTRAVSCRDAEGKLLVCTPEDIADKDLYSVRVVEAQLVSIPNGSDVVVRCCVQLLEEFATVVKNGGINSYLPDPLPCCLIFFRDVARAILTLTGTCGVIWREVEKQLKIIAVELRAQRRRNEFVALMSYRSGIDQLRSSIQAIQKELLQTTILDDHAVYFVRVGRPARRVDSLLNTLARTNFLDLCGEKHAKTRHRIATVLSMDEMEVIKRIKSKGVSNVFDAGMFRDAGLHIHDASYSSKMDRAMIKDILAPHINSQDALIAQKARSFNPRTCQWAMQDFDEWMRDQSSNQRCFILVGAPASGKTTLVSNLVQERSSLVLASHYCRHDDNHTIDPKEMLLSISYQLCLQSVAFENKIRALLVGLRTERTELLSHKHPVASLFRDFLESPLHDIDVTPDSHQCIVIDGIELGNEGTGDQNPILKALRTYLSYLPPWIRFVVVTTPQLSIIKRLRTFNSKVVQSRPEDTSRDMREFVYTALSELQYENERDRMITTDTLAALANGNYVYGKILVSKARVAKETNNRSLLADYFNLDFDQALEKDLALAEEGDKELFWLVVRMSLVSFRALNKADVIAFAGCTPDNLERLLGRASTFFLVTDTTVIRFDQKLLKRWLLNRMSMAANGIHPGDGSNLSVACTRARFHEELEACHRVFGQRILDVLNRSKLDNHFTFAMETTREYVLKFAFRHIIHGGMELKARELVLDPTMLIERVSDYDGLLEDLDLFSEQDELIQLLRRALSLSKEAISIDQRQMVSQLVGRLKAVVVEGTGDSSVRIEVQDFVRRLENHDYGFDWWCPLTSTWEKAENALSKRMKGHDGQIQCVALHKDDNLCASASWDSEIKVWNTAIGSCEVTFSGHTAAVWCIDWDHEGRQLVSGGADECLRIWNYEKKEPDWILRGHGECIFCAKFSPDSTLIASGSKDKQIRIWNVKSGECEQTLDAHNGFVYSVDWKPNGGNRYLCSGGTDNLVRLWDLDSSSCILVLSGHQDWVRSVVWSANGRKIFSGSSDQTVIYWDAFTGDCHQVLMGHSGGVWAVTTSQDGRYVFSASVDQTIKAWECSTWKCDQTLKGHEGPVLSIAVSSDGNKLVSGGSDNVLALWDCEVERKASGLDGHSKPIWGIDITPDSRYIASASSDHTVRIWKIATGLVQRVFTGHTGPVWAAKFSHSTNYVATASSDNTAAIYRLSTGGIKHVLAHSDAVWSVAWAKDDEFLFTSCRDLVIRRWDTKHGSVTAEYRGHTKAVKALSISMDGMRMASASLDASIRIWDLSTDRCERILQRKDAGAVSVEWLNDECLAAGYTSGCVRYWNAITGQREIGFLPGHSRRTNAVSGSPDGSRIVSASTDKEIRIWNIATEECERRISGGSGLGIFCVKWAQDGHYIVSGGSDRAIRAWQPETGRCVHVMGGVGGIGIYEVNWSPSGRLVASGSCDRKVEIWNPETGKCLHSLKGHTNWVHAVEWEEGEKRILSRSDDGTARVWNVETGECEKIYNDAVVPEGFLISSSGISKTVDLSGKAEVDTPIGIDIHKARVHADMCCGWIGKSVYFFKLKRSSELQKSRVQFGGNSPDDGYESLIVELKD